MGTTPSRFMVLDWSVERQFSQEHNISEWEEFEPKNTEYYEGTRFFKVSKSLYPQYTRGWLYGYYENDWMRFKPWYKSIVIIYYYKTTWTSKLKSQNISKRNRKSKKNNKKSKKMKTEHWGARCTGRTNVIGNGMGDGFKTVWNIFLVRWHHMCV